MPPRVSIPFFKPTETPAAQNTLRWRGISGSSISSFPRPSLQYVSDFDDDALATAAVQVNNETRRLCSPRYPYQYLSFNTFRYMSIQLLRTSDIPFGELV